MKRGLAGGLALIVAGTTSLAGCSGYGEFPGDIGYDHDSFCKEHPNHEVCRDEEEINTTPSDWEIVDTIIEEIDEGYLPDADYSTHFGNFVNAVFDASGIIEGDRGNLRGTPDNHYVHFSGNGSCVVRFNSNYRKIKFYRPPEEYVYLEAHDATEIVHLGLGMSYVVDEDTVLYRGWIQPRSQTNEGSQTIILNQPAQMFRLSWHAEDDTDSRKGWYIDAIEGK